MGGKNLFKEDKKRLKNKLKLLFRGETGQFELSFRGKATHSPNKMEAVEEEQYHEGGI